MSDERQFQFFVVTKTTNRVITSSIRGDRAQYLPVLAAMVRGGRVSFTAIGGAKISILGSEISYVALTKGQEYDTASSSGL